MTHSTVLQLLPRFNAKERFFLVGYALGNPEFRLGEAFCKALGDAIGITVPKDAYCAMDYHLDWLYAALHASEEGEEEPGGNADRIVKGHQQDVDLLVAFEQGGVTQLILIEAKGVGAWSNDQAGSKVERLKAIFGPGSGRWPRVRPWFVLMSPKPPAKLKLDDWPGWALGPGARPVYVALPVAAENLKRVTQWNKERGCAGEDGKHWKIVDR